MSLAQRDIYAITMHEKMWFQTEYTIQYIQVEDCCHAYGVQTLLESS